MYLHSNAANTQHASQPRTLPTWTYGSHARSVGSVQRVPLSLHEERAGASAIYAGICSVVATLLLLTVALLLLAVALLLLAIALLLLAVATLILTLVLAS